MRMIKLYLISATAWCFRHGKARRAAQKHLYHNLCDGNSPDWFFFVRLSDSYIAGSPSQFSFEISLMYLYGTNVHRYTWWGESTMRMLTETAFGIHTLLLYSVLHRFFFCSGVEKIPPAASMRQIKFNIRYVQLMRNENRVPPKWISITNIDTNRTDVICQNSGNIHGILHGNVLSRKHGRTNVCKQTRFLVGRNTFRFVAVRVFFLSK